MAKRTIFISHSSHEPVADARLSAIANALKQEFKPWFDKRDVRFGKHWYPQIEGKMAGCDAALLLFDSAALASDYVRHEMSVLSHRAHTEHGFRFFVAILDEQLSAVSLGEGNMRAARVAEMQIWRPTPEQSANDQTLAAAVADMIKEELGGHSALDPRRDAIVGTIKDCLADVRDDAFVRALDAMERQTGRKIGELWPLIVGNNPERRRWLLALWFVNQAEAGLQPVTEFLKPFARAIRNVEDHQTLSEMLEAAESYWVGASDQHCPFYQRTRTGARGGVVAANGQHLADYTVKCFAHRALTPDSEFIVVPCHEGASKAEVIASITASLERYNPGETMTNDLIRHLTKQGRPTICVLPQDFIAGTNDTGNLRDLRTEFDSIVFVIWPGRSMEDGYVPDDAARIMPVVDTMREAQRHKDLSTLHQVLHAPK